MKQNNWIASYNAKITAANQKRSDTQAKFALANPAQSRLKGYLIDGNGNPILRNGRLVPVVGYHIAPDGQSAIKNVTARAGSQTTPSGSKPLSLTTLTGLVKSWYNGVSTTQQQPVLKNGVQVKDANGNPVFKTVKVPQGPVNYQRAYKLLLPHLTGNADQRDKQARQILDTVYVNRGQNGRAWMTNEEQATLKKLRLWAPAQTIKNPAGGPPLGYITVRQAKALNQAGRLPAGEQAPLPDGRVVYFIHPG